MTKRISNYTELMREKEELELQLQMYKDQIRLDIREIREELHPATRALAFMGKFFKKDRSNPIMTSGTNMLIDVVVKKLILSRASWVTRLIVPFFLKNYSSHLLAEKKTSLWKKVKSWIQSFGHNGSSQHEQTDVDLNQDPKVN